MKTEINIEMIENLSNLSKLRFNENEKEELKTQVQNIIGLLDQLGTFECSQADYDKTQKISELREDNVEMSMSSEEVFLNSPNSSNGYFVVPKVVDWYVLRKQNSFGIGRFAKT